MKYQVTKGNIEQMPEEAGYRADTEEKLLAHFERLMDRGEIQGASYCVALHGKVIMHGAIGEFSYKKDGRPFLPDSINRVASITKIFTTMAVMQFVERGVIRLDTPVGDILPPMKEKNLADINFKHLLTHTSGLVPDDGCFPNEQLNYPWDFIGEYIRKGNKVGSDLNWLKEALRCGLRRKPGEEWQYCSFGFVIASAAVEVMSGMPFSEYVKQNILDPLGMKDSGFEFTKEMAERAIRRGERSDTYLDAVSAGKPPVSDAEDAEWEKIPEGGGGLISTAADLVKFGNMVVNGGSFNGAQIIGRQTLNHMCTPAIPNTPDYCWGAKTQRRRYGIGFDMRDDTAFTYSPNTVMHEGAGACSMDMDRDNGLVAAWFVPFAKEGWFSEALYSVQNIIWGGLK